MILAEPEHGGTTCGNLTDTTSCFSKPCPVNCNVTAWSVWSDCSKDCDGGLTTKARTVINQAKNGGKDCPDLKVRKPCNTQKCDGNPDSCVYEEWSDYSKCDKKCDGGKKIRSRKLLAAKSDPEANCDKEQKETLPCHTQSCPVDCKQGDWMAWGQCDRECGPGQMKRSRSVAEQPKFGGKACGFDVQQKDCEVKECAVPCRVSDWSPWSECDKLCGKGNSERTRRIMQEPSAGNACPSLKQLRQCNFNACPVDCVTKAWSGYSQCNHKCGSGVQTRTREVRIPQAGAGRGCGALSEPRKCNTHPCPVECDMSDWSDWTKCSKKCGIGTKSRTRKKLGKPKNGGTCGPFEEIKDCFEKEICSEDCVMSDWKFASECSRPCGGGTQKRVRDIVQHSKGGGKVCGLGLEFVACNENVKCDDKSAKLKAMELTNIMNQTKTELDKMSKDSELFINKTEEATMAQVEVKEKYTNATAKYQNMKVKMKETESQSSFLKAKLIAVKKARFPNMHKIMELAAIVGTLSGVAKANTLAEIKGLATKSATQKKDAKTAEVEMSEVKSKLNTTAATIKGLVQMIAVSQKSMTNFKPMMEHAEMRVKKNQWKERTSKNAAAHYNRVLAKDAKQLKLLSPSNSLPEDLDQQPVISSLEDLGEHQGKEEHDDEPKQSPVSEDTEKLKAKVKEAKKEARVNIVVVSLELREAEDEAKRTEEIEGDTKLNVQAIASAFKTSKKANGNSTGTAELRIKLSDAQDKAIRGEIWTRISGYHKRAAVVLKTLRDKYRSCLNGVTATACTGLKKEHQVVMDNVKALKESIVEEKVNLAKRYPMKCGDGKYQNENGEQCDDGNIEKGDGCDADCKVEKGWSCAGGSWKHESSCDKCGNGKLRSMEQCDDGNIEDGDGCSSSCKIELSYTCSTGNNGNSICKSLELKQKLITNALDKQYMKCAAAGKFFVPEGNLGGGNCIEKADVLGAGKVSQVAEPSVSSVVDSRVVGGTRLRLTCPMPLNAMDVGGKIDAAPFAVCSENRYEACETTLGTDRVCKFRKQVTCEEVCVAPRFCESTEKPQGQLVHRQYGTAHTPSGKACCFKHCQVPPSWTVNGIGIQPTSWCLPFAHEGV